MRHIITALLITPLLTLFLGFFQPMPSQAQTAEELAHQVIVLTNMERASQGLPPLKLQNNLRDSAMWMAQDMAENDYFDHTDALGRTIGERIPAFGYTNFTTIAENIAAGQPTPAEVMTAWMNSAGHRVNILSADMHEIGVGYFFLADDQGTKNYNHYWVQNFGRRFDAYPVVINGEAITTSSPTVQLYIYGTGWADEMRITNDGIEWTNWQPYQSSLTWTLLGGSSGTRNVTVELRQGSTVRRSSDIIELVGNNTPTATHTATATSTPTPTGATSTPTPSASSTQPITTATPSVTGTAATATPTATGTAATATPTATPSTTPTASATPLRVRIEPAAETVLTFGTAPDITGTIRFPANSVTDTIDIALFLRSTPTVSPTRRAAGPLLVLEAFLPNGDPVVPTFIAPFSVTIHYPTSAVSGIAEDSLRLYGRPTDDAPWQLLDDSPPADRTLSASLTSLRQVMLIGERTSSTSMLYLPFVVRSGNPAPPPATATPTASPPPTGSPTPTATPESGTGRTCLTAEEAELARRINDYRASNGLPPVPVAKSLTQVGQAHVRDLHDHEPDSGTDGRGMACNMHSWSNQGNWTPVCYTSDHEYAEGMWNKPREVTNGVYTGNGYEIAYGSSGQASASDALRAWQRSSAHNEVILEQGIWAPPTGKRWALASTSTTPSSGLASKPTPRAACRNAPARQHIGSPARRLRTCGRVWLAPTEHLSERNAMVLTGYTHRLARNLTPATIIAPEHAASGDPAILAAHCLEAINPSLPEQVREGDILILAGHLATPPAPGTGMHLRDEMDAETAILALQALGIAAVVCEQVDPALAQLAGERGLPILTQPAATTMPSGHLVRLDLERGTIQDQTVGTTWHYPPCSPLVLAAVQRTLLLMRMRRVVEDEGYAE